MRAMKFSALAAAALCALAFCASPARAEVTRIVITKRADVGQSGYEKIIGTIFFAVDPNDPHNRLVADLDKAPRNASGRVEFSSDLYILRPKDPARSNNVALVDILNRGNKIVLNGFNKARSPDPDTESDLGDLFLMRFGYTIVWVGWEFDVADRPELLRLHPPVATAGGTAISGVVRATFTSAARATEFTVTDLAKYDASDPGGADSLLTVRSQLLGAAGTAIPRAQWRVKGHTITLDAGFEPGRTYEIRYRTENPPVSGLGFVAVRDTAAWIKHEADGPLAPLRYAFGYGSSQSGRFLRGFLYEGFNTDERDRQVFDGVMAHIAGASRLSLNERWATPTGLGAYNATAFPFADASLRDPISGAVDGALENARASHVPKVFYTNTPVEYWGTGRVAALVTTNPAGTADLTLSDNVRVYFIAGTQHSPARFPAAAGNGQQIDNAVDYWWTMRALLLAMNRWVKQGTAPPASQFPRLLDRTLVPAASVSFPAIPGVHSPRQLTAGVRTANALIPGGGGAGAPLPLLVPNVDADGNEISGIRLPDVSVPLATYTGWNFRKPAIGAPDELVSLLGSTIFFPATRADRSARGDPRRSIDERYPSREAYLERVQDAADALVKDGYVLVDDEPKILQRASDQWDLATARSPAAKR
jgi:hypothetical protein